MNDYLILPIIAVILFIFFINYMIMDSKFHKSEMSIDREFHKSEMRDIDSKYKLERIQAELERIKNDIRKS